MTKTVSVRTLAIMAAILFLITWLFPLGVSLAKDTSRFPRWYGPFDVGLAFAVALAAFGIQTLVRRNVSKRDEETAYRIYRFSTHGLLLVAVLVILAGDRIAWANCATGFLWRTWLGLYILPWWLAALRLRDPARV